ncbi:MAG: VIT domain-containing protein [Pseudomonadota bacterium]
MLTRALAFVLFATLAFGAHASRAPPRIVAVGAGEAIQIQQLSIHAEISGGMAETTVRMVLFNPNHRQLEGSVEFPLAEGQQISAFALDINGEMRPAVPVGKARGRAVFEAIERRQVDPGLLEVTQGNNFKLRVYPIFARATRTVEITYTETLARQGANWAYRLPLAYGQVQDLQLSFTVNGASATPLLTGLSDLRFEARKGVYSADVARRSAKAQGEIEILSRAALAPRVYTQRFDEADWFVAEVPVSSVRSARVKPRVVGLLWDSSGSGAKRALDAEMAELERYFSTLGTLQVRLIRLRDRAEAPQLFNVAGGDWKALRRAIENTVYDGASALADWKPQADVDHYLMFSDGLSNYGAGRFPDLAAHQRLFTLNSAMVADPVRLSALAERNRGQYIAVSRTTPGAAARALLYEEARIGHISASGATDIEVESHTVREGLLRIAGRLLAPRAELSFTLSNGGKDEQIVLPLAGDSPAHPHAASTWAALRLRALEGDVELHRSEIDRIGRRFAIPTRETSLIVLEQLSDYLSYDIRPPAQLSAAFDKAMATSAQHRRSERVRHVDQVVQMYQQRIDWWNARHQRKPSMQTSRFGKRDAPVVVAMEVQQSSMKGMTPPPPPPPLLAPVAAAPAKAAMRAAGAADELARVEVTGSSIRREAGAPAAAPQKMAMSLKKWVPNAPYLRRLKEAPAERMYQAYLDQKPDYANSTAFFFDAADALMQAGQRELSLRVLSNLAEMELENRAALRILGYRLLQAGAPQLAVPVFEQVLRIAEEEPQSFRDLGLALAGSGRAQEAIDTMYEVVERTWDQRFPDIETITLAEINAIVSTSGKKLDVSRIDPRLRANLPLDLRVVLSWDSDNSDMDLHVTDPSGEQSFYGNPLTSQGARMSRDFTGGYGPEEFALRRAKSGKYRIEASFFGHRQQVLSGATTVQVKVTVGFGTARQKEKLMTVRLQERSDRVLVGEFEVD